MGALATISLVGNVLQFVEASTKLSALIKEYSTIAGAPAAVVALSKRLELDIKTIEQLGDSGRARLDHEKLAMKMYCDEADRLRAFLESLKITSDLTVTDHLTGRTGSPATVRLTKDSASRLKWLRSKRASGKSGVEKGWKAFKALRGKEKLESFQMSLDRILDLIMIQQQSRVEATTLRLDDRTTVLVQNSESIIRGLSDLQLQSNQPPNDLFPMREKPILMLPLARNSGFLGRGDVMLQLDERLGSRSVGSAQVRTAALCGLGGIGKSQIAVEYAYRRKDQRADCSIIWIHGSTIARFEESYKRIATEFQLPGLADPHIDVLQLVRNWFESEYQLPWLMVVDNVDDTQILEKMPSGKSPWEYLPKVGSGSILFTSRNRDVAVDLANDPISISPLSPDEARILLGERTKMTSTDAEKDVLLSELDHLPLAIIHAASYMTKRNKTASQYLALFRGSEASRIRLLEHPFVDAGREAKSLESVATTWLISFQYIKSENPQAANLLFLMSFMDRQGIPASLITSNHETPIDFEEAVGILEAFSFISRDDMGANYSMHQLVQTVTRAWLNDYGDALLIQSRALSSLSSNFPNGEFETWENCARYLPHAESVLSRIEGNQEHDQGLYRSDLLRNLGWYFKEQGKLEIAHKKLEEALALYCTLGMSVSTEALDAKRKLARIIELQGRPEEARTLFREVLASQECFLGPGHLETLVTVGRLALALANTLHPARWAESESLAQRSLHGRKLVLEENDLKIADSLRTLGWVLYREEKYNGSEKPLRDCFEKHKLILGDRHPKTTFAANDLGLALVNLDAPKYEEAEDIIRESASLTKVLYGTDHPNTISQYSNLCLVLIRRGKYKEAEALQKDHFALSERVLGKNHPTTIWCIIYMAESLFYQKKYFMAESFIHKELSKRPQLLRHDTLRMLILVFFRGLICEELGRFGEAEEHFELVLRGRREELGDDNPKTLQSEHCLARVTLAQGRHIDAEKILRGLIQKELRILGERHEGTILSCRLYGHTMLGLGRFSEAENWFHKVLIAIEESLGPDHESTLIARDNLEAALLEQRKWAEWEASCRESLEIRRILAPHHFDTLRVMSNLWFGLDQQGKSESETIFNELLERIRTLPPDFMDEHSYNNNVSCEDEWHLWRLRNGPFYLAALRARGRMAARCSADGDYKDAEDIYQEVSKNMEKSLGRHCEATKQLNEEYATFLDQRGSTQEAELIRKRMEETPF